MSENEENLDPPAVPAVDPPKNDGGAQSTSGSESLTNDAQAVDPPKNDGGTTAQ